jgi:hypothetical protein
MKPSPTPLADPRRAMPATREELLGFLIGYCQLLAAAYEAREQATPAALVPVSFRSLRRNGVSPRVLHWALFQAHLDHFEARPARDGGGWQVRPSAVIGECSAFALTAAGVAFAELLVGHLLLSRSDDELAWAWGLLRVGELTPSYLPWQRVLAWGRHPLKAYRQPSENQEAILMAAEEMGWPPQFDDPLPRVRWGNPKVRLHDAIKHLNRHQLPHLVQFRGDGTGTRVGWELR